MAHLDIILRPVAPFRLDLTTWILRRRNHNIIDQFNGSAYSRAFNTSKGPFIVDVTQEGTSKRPVLRCHISPRSDRHIVDEVKANLSRILGFEIDLSEFYSFAKKDVILNQLVTQFVGFKPPRFPSIFEALINGICCQQLSLNVGITLLDRLAMACSDPLEGLAGTVYPFPTPAQLMEFDIEHLREMGFSANKAIAISELSANALKPNWLGDIEQLPDDEAIKRMKALRGIGRWTAEYALLRGLGRVNVYPGDDIGFQNGLKIWLKLSKIDLAKTRQILAAWQPYGGLIYFHMLLNRIKNERYLDEQNA